VAVPEIDWREERPGSLPGNRYLRIARTGSRAFTEVSPEYYVASEAASTPETPAGRFAVSAKRLLIGRPIPTAGAAHERLTKTKALAILASDALASVAYGTEALLVILMLGGAAAFAWVMPISFAILALLILVTISYRQTIPAYPGGGGSYIVARENLGTMPGLVAAAALMVDYILNVSVSISAGVLALISAFPELAAHRVAICLGVLLLVMLVNLRGLRESGTIFAIPTYFFVVSIFVVLAVGLIRILMGDPAAIGVPREAVPAVQSIGLFLILRAFANGCSALTGVEAISNGIPAFKKPETRNASITLTWVAVLLGVMFIGVSFLARQYGIVPHSDESVVSQIAAQVFGGRGIPYYLVQAATILILLLATNTSYAGFPRLASILARDGFLPHQFQFRGDRLAFTIGIVVLTIASGGLLVVFGGETNSLIPLFAIGAFLAFTFSQAGMVQHWRRMPGNHRRSLAINATGAITTGITALVIVVSKFREGAWITVLIIPVVVLLFLSVARHYRSVAAALAPTAEDATLLADTREEYIIVIPISSVNKASLHALAYARRLGAPIVAVHVTDDVEEGARVQREWKQWVQDVDLITLETPYRSLVGPLIAYVSLLQRRGPHTTVTVLVPEYIPQHWWEQLLHSQTALRLKAALLFRPDIVVTSIPFHPDQPRRAPRRS
jgi:amino acid transporter